jgi:ferric-dicitrate binding protein FerR (iron transport regulator)
MTDNRIEILIARCISGEASAEEYKELHIWIEASKENFAVFQQYRNIWDNSENQEKLKMIDVNKSYQTVMRQVDKKSSFSAIWKYWRNIAAILLIPLIAGNLCYLLISSKDSEKDKGPVYNEIYASFGTRSAINLPDGTSLWLNSGSSLKYPEKFKGAERRVFLNGEAYFEVESNPKKPFIVETSSLSVRATGTKFNVSGYNTDNETDVTLISGKVEVKMTDDLYNQNTSELKENQHLSFNKNDGTSSIITGDTYKYVSWKDGKLIFRDEPLSYVAKKLGQVFNVDIELKGKELQNYRYRATFKDESLEEILKLLKISSPVDYTEVRRDPLPDNTYPKKKIIIFNKTSK